MTVSGTPTKIGIIGCGNISGIYLKNGARLDDITIAAVADMIPERAQKAAQEHNIPKACTVKELLADPEIQIVVNLTIPKAHFEVAMQAVEAGKSVYNEKPLTLAREQGKELLAAAKAKGVLVGGAPDTFLGAGIQTCRKLIDDGWIGTPIAATAFMACHGHETWHPAPEFYYQPGGGPMFDMGPYYLTALINLIGPVRRATGMTAISLPERRITSQPLHGKVVKVEVPTHVTGLLEFANGALGTIIQTFDVWASNLPLIEIHGTRGSLSVPDPNGFGGAVQVKVGGVKEGWQPVPLTHASYSENSRGLGVADMARALVTGRKPRAGSDLTFHVLDIMHAVHDAAKLGRHVDLESTCERPAPLPLGLAEGTLD